MAIPHKHNMSFLRKQESRFFKVPGFRIGCGMTEGWKTIEHTEDTTCFGRKLLLTEGGLLWRIKGISAMVANGEREVARASRP